MVWDPFPAVMFVSVLLWVGMGLAAWWSPVGLVLCGVGLLVILVGQLYLYALIFQDSYEHASCRYSSTGTGTFTCTSTPKSC